MDGRLRRPALVFLLVLGILAAGCGGDDEEQTTIDLTGLVTLNVSDEVPVDDQEELQAAIVRSIQARAPSNVRVVYNGGGGSQTDETGAHGEICQTIPQVCSQEGFDAIMLDAFRRMGPQAQRAGGIVQGDGGRQAETDFPICLFPPYDCGRKVEVNIAGVRAEVSASESGEITTQIVELPPGVTSPDGAGGNQTGDEETTGTETDTATTETAPTETAPVEPAPVEPAPVEPAPAPTEP